MQFDVDTERDTFFEAHDAIRRDLGKFYVYEMPPIFYSTLVEVPSRQHGTLQKFFESCLSLAKDLDGLIDIVSLVYQLEKG